jgi:hypothetical protein
LNRDYNGMLSALCAEDVAGCFAPKVGARVVWWLSTQAPGWRRKLRVGPGIGNRMRP